MTYFIIYLFNYILNCKFQFLGMILNFSQGVKLAQKVHNIVHSTLFLSLIIRKIAMFISLYHKYYLKF